MVIAATSTGGTLAALAGPNCARAGRRGRAANYLGGGVPLRWKNGRVSRQTPSLELVGVDDDGRPFASRWFSEIREGALARWESSRVDADGEPWECRWQLRTQQLEHDGYDPADCGGLHVGIYCSLNDAADHLVDLLSDERLDRNPFGTLPGGVITPWPHMPADETARLFRFYVRVLWAAEVFLEDLQQLLSLTNTTARTSKTQRSLLSRGAPLNLHQLRGFINSVGKHALQPNSKNPIRGMHCWNHHADIYFEDADLESSICSTLNAATPAERALDGHSYEAVLMPRLADVVDTIAAALVNLDAEVIQAPVIDRLAGTYGRCWPG